MEYKSTIVGQAKTTTYSYDAANQLTTAQEGSGTAWQYHYDGNGSLVDLTPGSHAGDRARHYNYIHNTMGNRTQVKDANGHVNEFQYDALNRVAEKIDPLGNTWQST